MILFTVNPVSMFRSATLTPYFDLEKKQSIKINAVCLFLIIVTGDWGFMRRLLGHIIKDEFN